VGYTDPQGTRKGLGALLLGLHGTDGQLKYAGRVGTGFDAQALKALKRRLEPLRTARSPLAEKPSDARGHWVKPELVAEVSFSEWTPDGRVRHAVFHGLRGDKPAAEITQEKPVSVRARGKPGRAGGSVAGVDITHPDRVIDPSTGATKRDLVNHYLRVARRLLPHLADRPVAMMRAPSGVDRTRFFQKHAGSSLKIEGLRTLNPLLDPGNPPLMVIDTFEALIGAAQMNAVEFHTWNAKAARIEQPDRMIFDLDPGEGAPWPQVQEAAELTRVLLDELELRCFLKTSGGKGLHVVVPLTPNADWDTVRACAQAVVRHMAKTLPSRFTAQSGERNRIGKVFVDYLRNGRGATTVAAFSVRARPGLGVSIPCAWDELPSLTGGAHWTLANVPQWLDAGEDPWAEYAGTKQTLGAAMKRLRLG